MPYLEAVNEAFGGFVDYAMVIGKNKYRIVGNPDLSQTSKSLIERHNLTMRMALRRFTRRTNAFSRKVENHGHAMPLYATWYNWVRPHLSLRKPCATTPAMAVGLTTRQYDMEWLLETVNDYWERMKARDRAAS